MTVLGLGSSLLVIIIIIVAKNNFDLSDYCEQR